MVQKRSDNKLKLNIINQFILHNMTQIYFLEYVSAVSNYYETIVFCENASISRYYRFYQPTNQLRT